MDETLTPDDAGKILEELLPAQNKSYELGLVLKLPPHEVEAIHSQYQNPQDRLLHVIIAFLKQTEPTWRVIVKALRCHVVNLPDLARRVEAAHYPDSITTHSGEFTTVLYWAITTPIPTNHPAFRLQKNRLSHQKIPKSLFFVLTCDASCLYILNGHSIFKQKYSKSSKIDTFLKRRFICRLVGMYSHHRSWASCTFRPEVITTTVFKWIT